MNFVIVVHFGIGVIIGAISAAVSLVLGYSVLWSLFVYSAAGILGMLLSATIIYTWPKLPKVGSTRLKAPKRTLS